MTQADYNYINSLLNKFMKAQTTEEEEQTLNDFFCTNHELPQEWLVYKDLFCSFKTDAYDLGDDELEEMQKPKSSRKRISVRLARWTAAACVAMALLAFGWQYYGRNESTPKHEPANMALERGGKGNGQSASKAQHTSARHADDILPLHAQKPKSTPPDRVETIRRQTKEYLASAQGPNWSTTELVETLQVLANMDTACVTVSAVAHKNGFFLSAAYENGQTNVYELNRCLDGSSIELTSQLIDN